MKKNYQVFLLFMIPIIFNQVKGALPTENQYKYKIITNITTGYNSFIRPSDNITIDIKLSLKQISSIDEKNQIVTTNSFFGVFWSDSRLSWEPSDYGNVTYLLYQANKLWIPDLFIINAAGTSDRSFVPIPNAQLAFIRSDGGVYLSFYLSAQQTRCNFKLKYFPFDSQVCSIVIGSWMLPNSLLTWINEDDDGVFTLDQYFNHPVWKLVNHDTTFIDSNERYFSLDKTVFTTDISFNIYLQRMPLYFIVGNIFPSLILNLVVIFLFALPFGVQIGGCMTIFMTFSVYSLNVLTSMPTQSQYLPMVNLYYMLGVSYTFIAYVWFILCNDFLTTNKLPKFLELFATKVLKRIWFWKFDDVEPFYRICFKSKANIEDKGNKSKIYSISDQNLDVISSKNENLQPNTEFSFLKTNTDLNLNTNYNMSILPAIISLNSNDKITSDSSNDDGSPLSPIESSQSKTKCNSCDLCENCQKDKQKDKDKKKKKDLNESNVSAINHFACFVLICIELICNMTVWLIISYPPNSY